MRALLLLLPTWAGLKAFCKVQVAERLAAGEAYKLMDAAGVRRVMLYMARHADLSFTKRVHVHPDPQRLRAGSDKTAEALG